MTDRTDPASSAAATTASPLQALSGHRRTSRRAVGDCTLVGAGPGDPQLLTLAALRAIRRATVLLVDDLVPQALVEFALRGLKRPPRLVPVGKRGGCESTPQAFIERLMAAEALAGERVVRLKGGDPFIFGRGGEEVQTLQAQGIPVRVVNGITSGLAAATAIGVPLTHRAHAQGVIFVTGHAKPGGSTPDWAVLGAAAAQGLTLVIYMGVAQVGGIHAGLMQGLPGDTPAAVIQHASLPQQRELVTTLAELPQALQASGLGSPAVMVIGEVLHARTLALQAENQVEAAQAVTDGALQSTRRSA
ncbi:uroporphyrinogen-III C-methyltransferase [Azohydromonas caseinilytica]|uniref:uroporphyrinogen-III C-methyltransferase n=1 Tax=Azohydromonas caseinilytica TaxID=2728836 RepID=A0A848F7C3_9BURK|nr:uroporphyrinogen-III C-methyltransferase [Azohydromonas caseinilytica]NML14646.1 uroporphyrinogen-III C-methyltransferase [Azohydromonas caseinilytica]